MPLDSGNGNGTAAAPVRNVEAETAARPVTEPGPGAREPEAEGEAEARVDDEPAGPAGLEAQVDDEPAGPEGEAEARVGGEPADPDGEAGFRVDGEAAGPEAEADVRVDGEAAGPQAEADVRVDGEAAGPEAEVDARVDDEPAVAAGPGEATAGSGAGAQSGSEPSSQAPAEPAPAPAASTPAPPPGGVAHDLAAFYDRRAPAALAYCARICEPGQIADAVEEAFGKVFTAAAAAEEHAPTAEELDDLLREAVRESAAKRARDPKDAAPPGRQAELAYDALSGDDAPALGRSLLGEVLDAPQRTKNRRTKNSRRPWRRRATVALAVVGTLLIAEAAVTLAWKEPFTTYLAAQAQDDLSKQLDNQHVGLGASDQRRLAAIHDAHARAKKRIALLAQHTDEQTATGEALGRIEIAKIGVDYVFVQGTDGASLRKGPGHYTGSTTLPGEGGVVGIAGHRTTYEAPFRNVDQIRAGDHITLVMPYGRFTYEVTGHRIVPSDYTAAFAATTTHPTTERLVLSACHPLYSATHRILIDAKLVSTQPLGAGIESSVPAVPQPSPRQTARARTDARLKLLGNRQLGPGMTGPDVRELQRLLGMPVTGTFDANTTAAVTAFQRDHGLPQIGRAGSQTKAALARRDHPPKTPPTPADVPQQRPTSTTPTYTTPAPSSTTPSYTQPQQSPSR